MTNVLAGTWMTRNTADVAQPCHHRQPRIGARAPHSNCTCLLLVSLFLPASVPAQNTDAKLREDAQRGRVEDVRALLAQGVSIDDADRNGRTALMLAAERGHVPVVGLLLENGASPALKDRDGRTARTIAFGRRHVEVVGLLDNARERIAKERAEERLASYAEGVTTHDEILRQFPDSQYSDRELALVYSGKYTAGRDAAGVLARSKAAPDLGIVRLARVLHRTGASDLLNKP
jgi:hypothetical protein